MGESEGAASKQTHKKEPILDKPQFEKSKIPPPPLEEKKLYSASKIPLVNAEKKFSDDLGVEKRSEDSIDRDALFSRVQTEKKLALIKAWEDNEKAKADNRAYRKLCAIEAWENSKKASVEAQLKQIEEKIENKKAEYGEKMKNKVAEIGRAAEEKKAMIEAKRGEDILKVEEIAANYRSVGNTPRRLFGCFGF